MKRILFLLVAISVMTVVSGCAPQPAIESAEPPLEEVVQLPEEDVSEEYPFLGIWFNEEHTSQLIITDTHFYYHNFSNDREVYAEIQSADLEARTLELRMYSILYGGRGMGFDSPMVTVSYRFVDESMQITLSRIAVAGGDQPVIYLLDEVLNH